MNTAQQLNKHTSLRISHQSEVLILRKQLVAMQKQFDRLAKEKAQEKSMPTVIRIPSNSGCHWVTSDEIIYCQAAGNYVQVVTETQTFTLSKCLKAFESLLPADNFIRCHQSYLINQKEIEGYYSKKGMFIQLKNAVIIPVSRRLKNSVLHALSSSNL